MKKIIIFALLMLAACSDPNLVGVSDNLGFVQGCATKEDQMALKKILEAAAPHIIDANLPKSEWRTDWRNLKEGDWVAFPVKQTKRPNLGIIKRLKNDDFENELWVTQGKNYFPFSFFEGFILLPQPPKDV